MQRTLQPRSLTRVIPTMFKASTGLHPLHTSPANGSEFTAPASTNKKEGDISSAFATLSNLTPTTLPPRFAEQKSRLIHGHEEAVKQSWDRLLRQLKGEIEVIAQKGPGIIPQVEYSELGRLSHDVLEEIKKRGVVVVKGVVPEDVARRWKAEIEEYVRANPGTKAFPPENPQVFELYWSVPQLRARAHPDLLKTQQTLMSLWHTTRNPDALISPTHPLVYADRLRIRHPGDAKFALGPHVDGGSVERWEDGGYGRGAVYDKVWEGKWEEYDPYEASCRVPAVTDLYNGAGACSMFRMWQGWLAMSKTGPGEGTLQVNPLLKSATAYFLLRPFFAPKKIDMSKEEFLDPENWQLEPERTSVLQGGTPGCGQEMNDAWHPHLELSRSMVNVPQVKPGDYVAWHCDTIHAVDKVHKGTSDSSVMYIPACPLTELNAEYVVRQREAFLKGTPGPDFPGGKGESEHVGRPSVRFLKNVSNVNGELAMGFGKWDVSQPGLGEGQRRMLERANEILVI